MRIARPLLPSWLCMRWSWTRFDQVLLGRGRMIEGVRAQELRWREVREGSGHERS